MTGVFIVDDSAFVRRALTRVLATEPGFRIVGEAASGLEALEKIPAADPDFVTLDVAMPGMGGLELLPALLKWKPSLRVVMLSAHTQEGAAATVAALGAGALDVIDKTTFNVMDLEFLRREVVERLKALAPRIVRPDSAITGVNGPLSTSAARAELRRCELCVIGASTGGPSAVQRIVEELSPRIPFPVIVVQHMPEGFTGPFAQRLNSIARVPVAEAVEGQRLMPGHVFVARAGQHLRVSPGMAVSLSSAPSDARHIPSIDVTMRSAARARPGRVLGILLTGMGEDGADGMGVIRAGGGVTIAESESTCVVYGMPRAAVRRGAATWVLGLPDIADLLGGMEQ
jgi:two-component system chemotaxis response regulator CheB